MTIIREGAFRHVFPIGWRAWKYDESPHYVNQAQRFAGGMKAVDIAAISDTGGVLYLVEIKDYRRHRREKSSDVFEELALKVRDTLAGLRLIAANASDARERENAQLANAAQKLRVVFHIEQPGNHSKLFPVVIDPKTLKDAAKRKLREVDPHPIAGGRAEISHHLPWTVDLTI